MLCIAERPGCGPSDVARFLGVANTTISSTTDRLAKRGFLERHRAEEDRWAVALILTDTGDARAKAYVAGHRELYRRMLAPFSPAEWTSFITLITKIVYHEN
ncbi:MarR family winged helix-turn-helix transcriptional regulator [Ancylobacter sp.]|uniref:MarR family winged helix-turn-helix transcriptional regulator n=1 Tax=Ancylobacter sp. TaxID=1872567 RepID=UPI003BAC1D5F